MRFLRIQVSREIVILFLTVTAILSFCFVYARLKNIWVLAYSVQREANISTTSVSQRQFSFGDSDDDKRKQYYIESRQYSGTATNPMQQTKAAEERREIDAKQKYVLFIWILMKKAVFETPLRDTTLYNKQSHTRQIIITENL